MFWCGHAESGHGKEPRRLSVRMSGKVLRVRLWMVVEDGDVRGTVTFMTLQRNIQTHLWRIFTFTCKVQIMDCKMALTMGVIGGFVMCTG